MELSTYINQYRKQVSPFTDKFYELYKNKANKIGQIPSEILDRLFKLHPKGKMHRGALVVLGYELAGGKNRVEAIKASIAWELYATNILIADDIIDRDSIRRGMPTIHKQWENYFPIQNLTHYGESMGIITAIIGFHLAPLALNQCNFPDTIKQKALNYLFESALETGYGEALDISTTWQTLDEKKQSSKLIHQYKTVNYSAVSPLLFGATLADCHDDNFINNLTLYGQFLGKIFQIQDDILGIFGNPAKTGKSNESDIKEGRWTILIELLNKNCSQSDRKILLDILGKTKRTKLDINIVKKLMAKYAILEKTQAKALAYLYKGIEMIPNITDNKDYQDTLKNLLEFMIKREK